MDSLLNSTGGFYSIDIFLKKLMNSSHIPKFEIFGRDTSPHTVRVPMHPAIPRSHTLMDHRYNSLSFFNLEFKFLLLNESNFPVTWFSYEPTTRDVVGRVSRSWAAFDVAATTTSRWILATTDFRWILAATFQSEILAAIAMGTCSWRASSDVGNASVDDTNVATAVIFFFTTDGKSFVSTFNCSIRNTSKY
jgi:hypothetical protein